MSRLQFFVSFLILGRILENVIGNVQFFNQLKGFGFIKRQGPNEKYIVHKSSTEEKIIGGARVKFDIDICDKGYEATNVTLAGT